MPDSNPESVKTPGPAPVTPAVPVPSPKQTPSEGTSLWNIQTQSPEWIPLSLVRGKLASGAYRTYAGSDVTVTAGIGGPGSLSPEKAVTAVTAGAQPVATEPRDVKAREEEYARQFDNAGDKALTLADGVVSGLSGGLLPGLPTGSDLGAGERAKRGEVNPGYKTLGELAALAGTVLAPESVLKYTPLGLANKVFEGASAASEAALGAKLGTGTLGKIGKKAVSDAIGGAVASGALSSANAISQAVQGKPVSGYAIIDDVGLGAAIGFGIGGVAEGLTLSAKKAADTAKQIQAAARFDESALPIRSTLTEVARSWDSAHNIAAARHEALEDLVKSGMLDAEVPGADWLASRTTAVKEADSARAKLHKLAGTNEPVKIGERLHDLAVSGKAKDAQKLYSAFDEYGSAVSRLDDAMQPTTFDTAHLGDVIGDLDLAMSASEHPLQRLEQMIDSGVPQSEIERFAKEIDDNYRRAQGKGSADAETVDLPLTPKQKAAREGLAAGTPPEGVPASKYNEVKARLEAQMGKRVEDVGPGESWDPGAIHKELQQAALEDAAARPRKLATDINSPAEEDLAKSTLLGGSRTTENPAGYQAKKILDQVRVERATGVMSPVRPTDLGQKIQGLMDELTAATGNRLGSAEARELAGKLGMNMAALSGPVSGRLADLWALHRMSEALGQTIKGGGSKATFLSHALTNGVVSSAGSMAYHTGGAGAAGTVRSLARHFVGAALYGAGAVTAVAGRFRQSAINGLAKALSPQGRRIAQLGGIGAVVSSTYQPGAPHTTNYETKATQLRWVAQNPEPLEAHFKKVFGGLAGVDPVAYQATVDAAMTRVKNLAKALPDAASWSFTFAAKQRQPTDAQRLEWHQYEAATADRELVFRYLKAGYMPASVVSAMNEQHPDYMQEVRDYVMNNPDEVRAAPHDTKMALSKLLGVPLVPEANPDYVRRMQEPYLEAKQKAETAKMQNKGMSGIQPMPMTAGQLLSVPVHN